MHTEGRLYIGAMNDCLFLIDRPPRPSTDDYPHCGDRDTKVVAKLDYLGAGENARRLCAAWNALLPFSTEQIERDAIDLTAVVAERDALRAGEQLVKEVLVKTFAAAIAGLADAAVIKQREYGFEDVAGAVKQLGEYAKGLVAERDAALAMLRRLADVGTDAIFSHANIASWGEAVKEARELLAKTEAQS